MSAYSESERPPRDEAKARETDEMCTFKKANSVHDRPPVTDHDFHKDLMDDPPHNVPDGAVRGGTRDGMKAPTTDEIYDEIPGGTMGEDMLGRKKPVDVQNDLIDTSETASRV